MKFVVAFFILALTTLTVLGQDQGGAPTLRIVTEDPALPSSLYYGNVQVRPLRLRPGTNQPITIDDNDFFIQQHYIDFLGRMPEPSGMQGWLDRLNTCPRPGERPQDCDRIEVSSAFYRSAEFQDRGYFLYRFYEVAFARFPRYEEFIVDMKKLNGFQTAEQLEANKVAFINEFMTRPEFANKYGSLSGAAYVDALLQTSGLSASNRNALITQSKAQALRTLAESSEAYQKYYNRAFVVMQYFGYLRRNPDGLYVNWVNTLNQTGDYRDMINGFVNSLEYRGRF